MKFFTPDFHSRSGQALTTLIIVMFIGLSVMAATIAVVDTNSLLVSQMYESETALITAESGLEDAIIKLLRNPAYAGGTLTLPDGIATITLAPGPPIVVTARGVVGSHIRTIQARIVFQNGIMTVTSWKEI